MIELFKSLSFCRVERLELESDWIIFYLIAPSISVEQGRLCSDISVQCLAITEAKLKIITY